MRAAPESIWAVRSTVAVRPKPPRAPNPLLVWVDALAESQSFDDCGHGWRILGQPVAVQVVQPSQADLVVILGWGIQGC